MNPTLIVVDMQNDFITGSLGTKEGKDIIPTVKNILTQAVKNHWNIIFTKDTHGTDYLNTLEGKNLPISHCIKDTPGWDIIPDLKPFTEKATVIEKPTFGSPALLQYIPTDTDQVIFVGVCTDICVISNALLVKTFRPDINVTICKDACAGVMPETHDAALLTATSCQCIVLNANETADMIERTSHWA